MNLVTVAAHDIRIRHCIMKCETTTFKRHCSEKAVYRVTGELITPHNTCARCGQLWLSLGGAILEPLKEKQ
jgi:hypothetical protein